MPQESIKIPRKVVDADLYINEIRELVAEGHKVSMLITGNSMNPFLVHARDTIFIEKPVMPLKKGDMVFYQRKSGQFVMHRICRVCTNDAGRTVYYMVGDAQQEIEGPVESYMIFGHITSVCRKGKRMSKGNLWWEFFEHIWIHMIPFRKLLIRIYGNIYRLKEIRLGTHKAKIP